MSLSSRILGSKIEIPTLNGTVTLKIPPGTKSGQIFRLKNMGFPALGGWARRNGHQLVRIMIETPPGLTAEQKRLMDEFAKTEDLSKINIARKLGDQENKY